MNEAKGWQWVAVFFVWMPLGVVIRTWGAFLFAQWFGHPIDAWHAFLVAAAVGFLGPWHSTERTQKQIEESPFATHGALTVLLLLAIGFWATINWLVTS